MIASPLTDEFYAESYRLRKVASDMTTTFIAWFKENSKKLMEQSLFHSQPGDVFSILSVGSGEGDVDLEIIQSVIPLLHSHQMRLKYVAIEPNPVHCQYFQEKLQKISDNESIEINIQNNYFETTSQIDHHQDYDIILFSHVLYYFRDPYQAIQQALTKIKSTGKVILVHQEETGIPQIQYQHMMSLKGNCQNLLTAESIKQLLTAKKHHYSYQSIATRLDITECLVGSKPGIKIMSFCMECDLRSLPQSKLKQLSQAFQSVAYFTDTGQAFIDESIGIFVIPSLFKENRLTKIGNKNHDPTQDYWQLATHFHWSDLLSRPKDSNPLRILDIACGTGRWLQALQYYVKFKNDNATITCDLLDPNPVAMIHATQNLHHPFQFGQQYINRIQEVTLEQKVYDLLWSMHGFYTIPYEELAAVLRKCVGLLKMNGVGFVALATRQSFYVDFYYHRSYALTKYKKCDWLGTRRPKKIQ